MCNDARVPPIFLSILLKLSVRTLVKSPRPFVNINKQRHKTGTKKDIIMSTDIIINIILYRFNINRYNSDIIILSSLCHIFVKIILQRYNYIACLCSFCMPRVTFCLRIDADLLEQVRALAKQKYHLSWGVSWIIEEAIIRYLQQMTNINVNQSQQLGVPAGACTHTQIEHHTARSMFAEKNFSPIKENSLSDDKDDDFYQVGDREMRTCQRILYQLTVDGYTKEFNLFDLERAISKIRGSDRRTIDKWVKVLLDRKFIRHKIGNIFIRLDTAVDSSDNSSSNSIDAQAQVQVTAVATTTPVSTTSAVSTPSMATIPIIDSNNNHNGNGSNISSNDNNNDAIVSDKKLPLRTYIQCNDCNKAIWVEDIDHVDEGHYYCMRCEKIMCKSKLSHLLHDKR